MRALTSAAAFALILIAGPASAVTFSANLTVDAYTGTSGTELSVSNVVNPLTFDLNVGQSTGLISLFTLTIDDPNGIDHSTDENQNPISVLFDFFEPENGSASVTGLTQGHIVAGPNTIPGFPSSDYLSVEWDGPTQINIGGYELLITLFDRSTDSAFGPIVETCLHYYYDKCKKYGGSGNIKAKFELRSGQNPVPLPAALPLFATGLAALGWVGVRRRLRNKA